MRHSFPHWLFWLKLSFLKLSFILIIISSYEVSIIPQKAKESVDCKKRLEWLHFSQFWQGLWWMHVFPHMLCYVLCYIVRTHLFPERLWSRLFPPFHLLLISMLIFSHSIAVFPWLTFAFSFRWRYFLLVVYFDYSLISLYAAIIAFLLPVKQPL